MANSQIDHSLISRDLNLLTELEQYHDNTRDNLTEQLQIDSHYYETHDINCTLNENKQFKYCTLHINVQGLLSSLEHLKHLINKLETNNIQLDFILICETFLHGVDPDKAYSGLCAISGYQFIYKNRINRAKGVVAIYIKDDCQYITRDDLSTFMEGEFETIFVEVISKPKNLNIGEIYRISNTPDDL